MRERDGGAAWSAHNSCSTAVGDPPTAGGYTSTAVSRSTTAISGRPIMTECMVTYFPCFVVD